MAPAMADAGAAHGSDLFRIRRIFTLATADDARAAAPSAAASAGGELPLKIEAMAVHTHEKKQLLAMSIAADSSPNATSAHASAAAAVPSIALGRIPGIEPRKSRLPTGAGGSVADREKKKLNAPVASNSNYLLLRTIEEDQRARFWRFPVATNAKQQSAGKSEKLVALEFSPEGDWLAGLSSRKNRLHLIPVLKLIARQRKKLLDATYDPPYNRELMSVHQSVMNTQMASYLRATNEAGGLNGARYHSQVAGDDEQMSTLEFAVGIGTVTCCRWWRSMNGKNYCLVGGTENLISIVNVEENAEECRCELQNAGTIVSIDLFRENFRKEKRTTMLVKAKGDDRVTRYYRVVLEKKFQQQQRKQQQKQTSLKDFLKPAAAPAAATAVDDSSVAATTTAEQTTATVASSYVSSSGTQSFTTLPSFTTQSPMTRQTPQYVVKTFPQHFLEDMDFRPQRIKKNSPQVCLYAINGMLTSESSLAMYDPTARRASLYSNFQWSMRNEYIVPSLARSVKKSPQQHGRNLNEDEGEVDDGDGEREEGVVDVDVSYCTTDLLLLQGKTERSNQNVSTWISLPSHQGLDEDVATAHIVHYLSLHDNEKIERVVQSTSRKHTSNSSTTAVAATTAGGHEPSSEAQVIYILQTQHHVYECRPQWSRLALFKTLCAQSILLRDALSIGYALGIDMASLCQVVAETLCAHIHEGKVASDAQIVQWVRELYEVSRVLPSTAVEQLTSIGGARSAIEYAQQLLSRAAGDAMLAVDPYERKRVALLVLDLVLKEQLRANVSVLDSENDVTHQAPSRPRDQEMQDRLAANEKWMLEFLSASVDYDTDAMVDLCLAHQQVDKAVVVGRCRKQVHLVLQKIVRAGLAAFVSLKSLRALLAAGFASELSSRANRVILRSFAMEVQVEVLLAYPPAILEQRDWLLRNLASISVDQCRQLAKCVDPNESALATTSPSEETHEQQARQLDGDGSDANTDSVDVASSESMSTTPEEQVELFLTMLLRLNSTDGAAAGRRKISFENEDDKGDGEYSQQKLEQLMKEFAHRYRPPVMVARCVDYANWNAAASLYEAHGELVEAVESRLHSHKVLRPVSVSSPSSTTSSSSSSSTLSFSALRRRRQSSDASVDSATGSSLGAISDESEFQDAMREELFELLNSLVVQRHKETQTASVFITTTTDEMKAAILARLLVKWFEYGLPKTELEVFLIDPKVYPHVSSLLAKIFFLEVVDGILGGGESVASAIRSSNGSVSSSRGFDDRDKEWVRKCHHLPFSGQFLFHVCVSFLDHGDSDSSGGDGAASSSSTAKGNASYHGSSYSAETRNATQKLLDLVKENVLQNDLSIPVVKIEPHSAQALGKSDPLETHVKVFTCGHVFPKRVFDEEILYEFEKRMNTLPLPLFSTKQVLLKEFKSSAIEAPCPICSFNKISTLVQQHQRLKRSSQRSGASASEHSVVAVVTPRPKQQQPAYYFLHAPQGQQRRNNMHNARGQQQHQRWQHDEWEWRATA